MCMYVIMYVCMYVCMHACVYLCFYIWMYVSTYVCMCVCIWRYVCMCVCLYIWMFVYMYVCVYVYMYVCICMYLFLLSNIMLSSLIPYAKEIFGYHQCGFRRNRSTIDHKFRIRQILEKKIGIQWTSSSALYRLQESDSVTREVLYKILMEFGIPRKLLILINLSLTKTYSRVRVGKNVSDRFPIRNGLNKETLYHHCVLTLLTVRH